MTANTQTGARTTPAPEIPRGPLLSELAGMDEARSWAESVVIDARLVREGKLDAAELEPGCVLYGPPGTGKTTLARALAATASLPLIATSYADWTRGNHYGVDIMNAIMSTFKLAAKHAPCIVAIDELDSIPDRKSLPASHHGTHSIVNTLLEQLDGLNRVPGVVVVGTCNHPDRLDPALVRSGRLGQKFEIQKPDLRHLPQILRFHLGRDAAGFGDLGNLALLCVGKTGADIKQLVTDGRRRARQAGRPFGPEDIRRILAKKTDTLDNEALRRLAVHEAGHGVTALRTGTLATVTLALRAADEPSAVINPNASGKPLTLASLDAWLTTLLAGRAAEEVFFGNVSASAGGTASSDLGQATRLALDAVTRMGLYGEQPLFWYGLSDSAPISNYPSGIRDDVEKLLHGAYASALDLIGREWDFVNQTAEALIRTRALSHREFIRLDRRPQRVAQ